MRETRVYKTKVQQKHKRTKQEKSNKINEEKQSKQKETRAVDKASAKDDN